MTIKKVRCIGKPGQIFNLDEGEWEHPLSYRSMIIDLTAKLKALQKQVEYLNLELAQTKQNIEQMEEDLECAIKLEIIDKNKPEDVEP